MVKEFEYEWHRDFKNKCYDVADSLRTIKTFIKNNRFEDASREFILMSDAMSVICNMIEEGLETEEQALEVELGSLALVLEVELKSVKENQIG